MKPKLPRSLAVDQLVEVIWVDSRGCTGNWESRNDVTFEVCRIRSVGYVMHHDAEVLAIVGNVYDAGPNVDGYMVIPKRCIDSIVELNRPLPEALS